MATYQQLISHARTQLQQADIYDGFAFNLMVELCQLADINLYLDKDNQADATIFTQYQDGIQRLIKHEPIAYVLGFEWFYGRRFKVGPEVLIPRQETEELIEQVILDIDEHFPSEDIVIADVGTGSGNCAITLQLETNKKTYATDISSDALKVAQENNTNLESSVQFFQGDMGQPLISHNLKVDILVCNPPYILETEEVQTSVLNYEPHVALFGGQDGLKFYRQILDEAKHFLNPKAMIAFEMGYTQKEALNNEINWRYPEAKVVFKQDLNHKDRMCFVYLNLMD